jgi:outer membrane protein assembly factor BamB
MFICPNMVKANLFRFQASVCLYRQAPWTLWIVSILLFSAAFRGRSQEIRLRWTKSFGTENSILNSGKTIARTSDGSLIVAGDTLKANGDPEYLIARYSPDGQPVFTVHLLSPRVSTAPLGGLALDAENNVYTTSPQETMKLDPTGSLIWSVPCGGGSIAANSIGAEIRGLPDGKWGSLSIQNQRVPTVDLIHDCDPGFDVDDISDLSLTHVLTSRGEFNLLATMGSHPAAYINAVLDGVNAYFGRTNILSATPTNGAPNIDDDYGTYLSNYFAGTLPMRSHTIDATTMYRRILSSRPDHSVTIIFTGQLRNLFNLWNSKADLNSPLDGPALLERKVRRLVIVAGFRFGNGSFAEYNLGSDAEAALIMNSLTNQVQVTMVPIDLGDNFPIPTGGIGQLPQDHPARIAHEKVALTTDPSWAGPGLLFAARGLAWGGTTNFSLANEEMVVSGGGINSMASASSTAHNLLWITQPVQWFIDSLSALLLEPAMPENEPVRGVKFHARENAPSDFQSEQIAQDLSGNSLVARVEHSVDSMAPHKDRFSVTAYSQGGGVLWTQTSAWLDTPNGGSAVRALVVNTNGSSWVLGHVGGENHLVRFSANGALLWDRKLSSSATLLGAARAPANGIRVATLENNSLVSTLFDAIGGTAHQATAVPPANVQLQAFTADLDGNLYLTGSTTSSSEAVILKYTELPRIELRADGAVRLGFAASPSASCVLQRTDNFVDWTDLKRVVASPDGIADFEIPSGANGTRGFFRMSSSR